jgi:class 3 adenylate cyclase
VRLFSQLITDKIEAVQSSTEKRAAYSALRESAKPEVARVIEELIDHASDSELSHINALAFADRHALNEEDVIAGFLYGSQLGLFDLAWNILCPGCGGVLETGETLKTVNQDEYSCALCACGYEPTLDEMVEVTFTVSPRVRKIAAHAPDTLPWIQYFRQVFWSSGVDLPDDKELAKLLDEITLDRVELPPGEKVVLSLQLPKEFVIIFDPVVHLAHFIDVKGEPTREEQSLSFVMTNDQAPTATTQMRPGPVRILLDNRSARRTLPGLWIAGDKLHHLLGRRRPFLTAKRLLSNQTFRDIYRTDTVAVDQRLKITSLTFLFTDLKGSTELYERVGDLVAYDLVRAHFRLLNEIVAAEGGAVVKTIGDAVMATFPKPERAMAAALRMRDALKELNEELVLKIGIHQGPCLAVSLNDRQDYFGQTVNIASRVQGLANARSILVTREVVEHGEASKLLRASGVEPTAQQRSLRGIANQFEIFEIT